jgi:hypothetical protein
MVRIQDVIAFLLWLCLPLAASAQVPFQLLVKTGSNNFLAANNATLNFASAGIGKTVSSTIVLTYQGITSASVNQPQIFGPNSFTVTAATPSTLNPGDSLSLTVQFTPSDAMVATAQINIPYTEKGATSQSTGTNGTIAFTLSGTVASLVVTYAFPTDGNVVTIDTGNTIGFPSTVLGTSIMAAMGVLNRGSGTGLIQSISISGNSFSLQSLPLLPVSVAPGSTVQFGVRYAPSQVGNNSGTLQIVFSDRTVTLGLQGPAILSLLSYQLLQGNQTTPVTPGQSLTFPQTNVGNKSSLIILAKNTSSSSTTISGATVSGSGFAISDSPILPVTLNINDTAAFTVTFAPTQAGTSSGKLRVGNDSFDLAGTAIGTQLVFSYTAGSTSNAVVPSGSVFFSPQPVGQTTTVTFTIQNTGTISAMIASIGVSGTQPAFTVSNPPGLPLSLDPGQNTHFSVVFSPTTTGLSIATLSVDTQQFVLSGFGNPPAPIPTYQFTGASGNQAPANQIAVGIVLDSEYSLEIDGKLTLSADNGSLPADPAVQFASGGRAVAFTIPANTTQAIFSGGKSQISLQTGTVAGTITIAPSFALPSGLDVTPMRPATLSISIPPGPPHLSNALVSQESPNTLTLQISGYAPTRNLSTLKFQFLAQPSANVANGGISLNIQPNAQAWFSSTQSQNFGGEFLVTVPFSFVSNQTSTISVVSLLQSVSITGGNDLGTSNSVAVALTQ